MTRSPRLALLGCILLLTVAQVPAQDERAELRGQILNAIDKGKEYLLSSQHGNGAWSFLEFPDLTEARNVGATALCGIAVMECGVPSNDPRIQKTARHVREAARDPKFNFNYSVNLCILFLHRVNQTENNSWNVDHADAPLIRELATRVMRGQNQHGGWGYHLSGGDFDNSNTQFGIVGLWVARKYFKEGKERDAVKAALVQAEQKFRKSQHPGGAWAYDSSNVGIMLPPSPSMTCAGLLGLAVGAGHRYQTQFQGAGGGSGETGGVYRKLDEDPLVKRALTYLETTLVGYEERQPGEHAIYFLWSLERTCVLFRWRSIGAVDWHAVGARFLFKHQKANGSWNLDHFNGTNCETAFAMLFLVKSNLLGPLEEAEFRDGAILAGAPKPRERPKPRDVGQQIKELFEQLPKANPTERIALLQDAEALPGDVVTRQLAQAVVGMTTEAGKDAVREALARRLAPWSLARLEETLREGDHRELRLAAARAAASKTDVKEFDDAKAKADRHTLLITLISTLSDPDKPLSDQAHLSLQALTGQDHGKNQTRWSKWLEMNRR